MDSTSEWHSFAGSARVVLVATCPGEGKFVFFGQFKLT